MKTKEEIALLVEENIKLVPFVMSKRHNGILKKVNYLGLYDDFYQEGCIGLFKAAKAFDESKGFKFTTFAFYWIDCQLRSFVTRYMPKHYKDNEISIEKSINKNGEKDITVQDLLPTCDKDNTCIIDLKDFAKTIQIKDIEKVINLSIEGFSQKEIGKKLGVSQAEISRRMKSLKYEYEIHVSLSALVRLNKIS